MEAEATIQALLEITRQEGHFEFRNRLHSNVKFVSDTLFQNLGLAIEVTRLLGERLYEKLKEGNPVTQAEYKVDGILGVSGGGKTLATWIAYFLREMGIGMNKVILTRRSPQGRLDMETGFIIRTHERYLVIEDVVTTGSSVREAVELIRLFGGRVVGVGYLIDRSRGTVKFPVSIQECLVVPEVTQWSSSECPLCEEGKTPIDRDGPHRR